jgi:hypothetical protein
MTWVIISACLTLRFALSDTSDKIAMLRGDIHLGGLFKIFNDEQCTSEIDAMSVRNFEAVKWTLQKLNEADYVPGITLGKYTYPVFHIDVLSLHKDLNEFTLDISLFLSIFYG